MLYQTSCPSLPVKIVHRCMSRPGSCNDWRFRESSRWINIKCRSNWWDLVEEPCQHDLFLAQNPRGEVEIPFEICFWYVVNKGPHYPHHLWHREHLYWRHQDVMDWGRTEYTYPFKNLKFLHAPLSLYVDWCHNQHQDHLLSLTANPEPYHECLNIRSNS